MFKRKLEMADTPTRKEMFSDMKESIHKNQKTVQAIATATTSESDPID